MILFNNELSYIQVSIFIFNNIWVIIDLLSVSLSPRVSMCLSLPGYPCIYLCAFLCPIPESISLISSVPISASISPWVSLCLYLFLSLLIIFPLSFLFSPTRPFLQISHNEKNLLKSLSRTNLTISRLENLDLEFNHFSKPSIFGKLWWWWVDLFSKEADLNIYDANVLGPLMAKAETVSLTAWKFRWRYHLSYSQT